MKRFLYILAVFSLALLLVAGTLVGALASSDVQTAAVHMVTQEFNRAFGTQASIGKVTYHFPARLRINDIYLPDEQADTLLYIDEVYAHLRPLALRRGEVRIARAEITGARVRAHQLPDGRYNYSYLLDLLPEKDTTETNFNMLLAAEEITLRDLDLRYDDWHATLYDADLTLRELSPEALDAEIQHLCGRAERDGANAPFELKELQAHVLINDTMATLPTLSIRLPESALDISGIRVNFPSGDTIFLRRMAHEITARLVFNEAYLSPKDIALFVPAVASIPGVIRLNGELTGSLDSLSAQDLALTYNSTTLLKGDIAVNGLPDIHTMYVKANLEDIYLNTATLQDVLSGLQKRPVILPAELRRIRDIHYRGTLDGTLRNMNLHGAFRTAMGSITTRGNLQTDTAFSDIRFSGEVSTRRFNIARILPNSGLGTVSLNITANGRSLNRQFPSGSVHGHVQELQFRGYTYHDLCLHGDYARQKYDGLIHIEDPNLNFRFEGIADLSRGQNYDFDITLKQLNPRALNLTQEDLSVSMQTHVNLSGFDPDKVSGYLVIDSLKLRNGADSLLMRQLQLIAEYDTLSHSLEGRKSVQIKSDYLTAKVSGQYAYTTLHNTILKTALRYLPALFSEKQAEAIRASHSNNKLDFYVYGRELKHLQKVLHLNARIADYPVIKGFIDEPHGQISLQAFAENVRTRSGRLENLTLSLNNATERTTDLDFSFFIPADSFIVAPKEHKSANPEPVFIPRTQIVLRAQAGHDSVPLTIDIVPDRTDIGKHNLYYSEGQVALTAKLNRYAGLPFYEVFIRPRQIQYLGTPYDIAAGSISYSVADTVLHVDNFRVGSNDRHIEAHGVASTRMSDSLHVNLLHIAAEDILPLVLPEKTLTVAGDITGWATLYGLFREPMFAAGAHIDDTYLCEMYLGTVDAEVNLNRANNTIDILGDVRDSTHLVAHVTGLVTPAEKAWGIDITPDSIPLSFINHWTHGILEDIHGYASGSVQVFGRGHDTWVTAAAKADGAGLMIPFTGCRYYFADSVFMDSTTIMFHNLDLTDEEGNILHFNGDIHHDSFTDFFIDLSAQPKHALAFNLPEKKGELLSGKVYADGEVHIYGPEDDLRLDASAVTVGKSQFQFSIDGASSASDNTFIQFVDKHTPRTEQEEDEDEFGTLQEELEERLRAKGRFTLSMNIDATPELLFRLMLNEGTGDVISARGEGGLRVGMDPAGDISLVGTYTIQSGALGFTVANVIRRDFTIAEGSQIVWSGNPEEPVLDVTAKYQVTASLRDLFGEDISTLGTTRTSVPVTCNVTMRGSLENPTIRFGLELPMSEDAIRDKVRSVINTDEMLMRQVVYLLVFGRFYTPEYMQRTTTTGVNEVYSLLSSTITGQINAWLGKLSNVFSMGVNIRTDGEGANSSQEYEAQFQLQPVDRLVINGNIGYRYNDISNRPFFGDVDVEYMLTPNGKVRIKGYTHTVDKYSLRQATTIQGIGFLFRHDFNWPKKKKTNENANDNDNDNDNDNENANEN